MQFIQHETPDLMADDILQPGLEDLKVAYHIQSYMPETSSIP